MKKPVLTLILLLIVLTVLNLTGCTVPDVNRGDVKLVMMIPDEFTGLENDVNLDSITAIATKDNKEVKITDEILDGDHGEVLFESLEAGSWTFSVEVLDTDGFTVFTGSEVILVTANSASTESILLTMSKASLDVGISHTNEFSFVSGSAYLLDYDGNGDLTKDFEFLSLKGEASFRNISPKACNIQITLQTTNGDFYTASKNSVKILPGRLTTVNFLQSDLTKVEQ
jgi:hypothetical protein